MRIPHNRIAQKFVLTIFTAFSILLVITIFQTELDISQTPAFVLRNTIHAQDKYLVWERFDVEIDVDSDGSMDICEHQQIRYTSGTFRFGFRDIPIRNLGTIDAWQIRDANGNIYEQSDSENPYTFNVRNTGSSYLINWYFPPISNEVETYSLCYTVYDALRFYEGGDQVWWKAIFGDRSFAVLDSRVIVNVPDDAQVQEWAAYVDEADAREVAVAEMRNNRRTVVFDLTDILNDEEFEVRVEFTPGVVNGEAQSWQIRADQQEAERAQRAVYYERWRPIATLVFGALAVLLLLGGPVGLYGFWYRFGRDKAVELVADYLPEPPDKLSPGMAGTLLDEKVDMEDILATLVDLARRKAISITEVKEEGFWRTGMDFIYRKERNDVKLAPYEEELLDGIFGKRENEVKLSELKNSFYKTMPKIRSTMYQAVVDEGLFPRNPDTVRNNYGCFAVALIAASFAAGFLLMSVFGDLTNAAVLPAIGLGITAVGLLILSRHMPRKTDVGSEAATRWKAFKNYLVNIDKYANMDQQKEIWDQWLPYAIAFGVDRQYIRKFEQVDAPAPPWYFPSPTHYGPHRRGYYGSPWVGPTPSGSSKSSGGSSEGSGGGLGDMSRGMGGSLTAMSAGLGSMLTSASSTFTSRPASSSSGGGWSSGGGGFSGGGSFGGGGGGGGGGGFG